MGLGSRPSGLPMILDGSCVTERTIAVAHAGIKTRVRQETHNPRREPTMTNRTNTFAAKMQAALDAQIAADKAYAAGDAAEGRKQMLMAHDITGAAAREAEGDAR